MSLPSPNLDDRTFEDLLREAKARIAESCRGWTDLSPSDPGMVLVELFCYLTDTMLYRLNRVPQKAYVEFLRLMGVKLHSPVAARVNLRFSLPQAADRQIDIPRGTQVTIERAAPLGAGSEPPTFVTARSATIPAGRTETDDVPAYHCEEVVAECVGEGTGLPGQSVSIKRPPIVSTPGIDADLDLVVGVEVPRDADLGRAPLIEWGGKRFRVWKEVETLSESRDDRFIYVTDRSIGRITFAPAVAMTEGKSLALKAEAIAEVPASRREIRVWYRRGGGPGGNVTAGVLMKLKKPVEGAPDLRVTNPSAATGGRAAETFENALARGPQELHSLRRAVTARDFELVAGAAGPVVRAKAFALASLWRHVRPGTVEVLLVPRLPELEGLPESERAVTLPLLEAQQTTDALRQVQEALEERKPLGTLCLVNWVKYKPVAVRARVVVRFEEDEKAVKARIIKRLNQLISPLGRWPFGQPLRAFDIYDAIQLEPGVRFAEDVGFRLREVPDHGVLDLASDAFQAKTWYASSGEVIFRSQDDGDGWEAVGRFPGSKITKIEPHPEVAGLVAVATAMDDDSGSKIHFSKNCGESWQPRSYSIDFLVHDLAWIQRDDVPTLLMATRKGLYALALEPEDSVPLQWKVDEKEPDRGFWAITVTRDARGSTSVAVAAREIGQGVFGVFLSGDGGRSFRPIQMEDQEVRVLEVQRDGPRAFLWAGGSTEAGKSGPGCFRLEISGGEPSPDGWRQYNKKWDGGSCLSIAFLNSKVLASTHRRGVLSLETTRQDPEWNVPPLDCGLPIRDVDRLLHEVEGVATAPRKASVPGEPEEQPLVLAGGPKGVYRSRDEGMTFRNCCLREPDDKVTLPRNWLFCPDEHEINVRSEDET